MPGFALCTAPNEKRANVVFLNTESWLGRKASMSTLSLVKVKSKSSANSTKLLLLPEDEDELAPFEDEEAGWRYCKSTNLEK